MKNVLIALAMVMLFALPAVAAPVIYPVRIVGGDGSGSDSSDTLYVYSVAATESTFDSRTLDTTAVQVIDLGSEYIRVRITSDSDCICSPDSGATLTPLNGDYVAAYSPWIYTQRMRYVSVVLRGTVAGDTEAVVRVRAER